MFLTSCEENDTLPNRFEQWLELSTNEYGDSTVICAYYDGDNVKEVKYMIFMSQMSDNVLDDRIVNKLENELTSEELAKINSSDITQQCCIFFEDLEYDVVYEVVSLAIFEDGGTQLCRNTIATKTINEIIDGPPDDLE